MQGIKSPRGAAGREFSFTSEDKMVPKSDVLLSQSNQIKMDKTKRPALYYSHRNMQLYSKNTAHCNGKVFTLSASDTDRHPESQYHIDINMKYYAI